MRNAQSIELTDVMRARIHARRHAKDDGPTAPEPIAARASADARDPQDLMTQITVLRMEELAGQRPMAFKPEAGSRPGSARASNEPLRTPKPSASATPPKRSAPSPLPAWFLPTILGLTLALLVLIVAALNEG
jgi:hypothetical protein